jgi:hypothetical protein
MDDPIFKELELLLLGCGFNSYRIENQMRADDLLVRQKGGAWLGLAAARLEQLAEEFQRSCMPAPTRQQPYPPAGLMDRLNALRLVRQRVLDQELFIQGLSAPAQDKIWRRLRDEAALLSSLLQADAAMLREAAEVQRQVESLSAEAWKSPDAGNPLKATLDGWDAAVRARQDLLQIQKYQ